MNKPKRIFIVGHMGAGKSLLAEALAKNLGWKYIDANPSLVKYPNEVGPGVYDIHSPRVPSMEEIIELAESARYLR